MTREGIIGSRVAVVAAHPDDEVIGLGGLLQSLPRAVIVHVTDGAPHERRWWGAPELPSREEYARVRRRELVDALSLAGIGGDSMHSLCVIDQEASRNLVGLAEQMAEGLRELQPELVFTHPYEGGHPDHDATAFAVHAACQILYRNGEIAPRILEFTSYHAGPDGGIVVSEFLPVPGSVETGITTGINTDISTEIALRAAEQEIKRRMIASFVTQRETLAWFPADAGVERIREAPSYDFTAPPHPGKLHYERFEWGWTGEDWRAHAREALQAIGINTKVQAGMAC